MQPVVVKSSQEIRREFIRFFEERQHRFVRSSPVVPQGDPTLLFTNAGMNQFKDVFLGTGTRDYTRAVNTQKCIRASGKHNDLEDVGRDNYHHTFFEMLGNWSFGDYFKREAIAWAWELLVDHWGLDPERLYATVFEGSDADGVAPDEEAERFWSAETPLPPERVLRFGKTDNFWEMGDTGPCGPCSEIHYDLVGGTDPRDPVRGINVEQGSSFIELWNLVFIQYNRLDDGSLEPLPARHVDTGMGFERITRVLQGKHSNYDTDLFTPILGAIGELTGHGDGPGEIGVAFRVIADHLRALSFAIADGALPSNEGRGYVLRRILRRAARYGRVLDMHEPFIHRLVPTLVEIMGDAFPELRAQQAHVARVIRAEEESFGQTLDRGLELFAQVAGRAAVKREGTFPGSEAFKLYDTFGFPLDLTRLMAEERGLTLETESFDRLMADQRVKSRAAAQSAVGGGAWHTVSEGPDSAFTGYHSLREEAVVRQWRRMDDGTVQLILDRTPFYAEAGGQVGDAGRIHGPAGDWRVVDTQAEGDHIVHLCRGEGEPDDRPVVAEVDAGRRRRTTLNHTATHLLHAALKKVLGEHVQQAGSVVHPDYLRFDYTHFERPDDARLDEIERLVNEEIRANIPLDVYETGYDEAMADGVVALFGEKYGDRVRVVAVDGFSSELCGGCHVRATGDIGVFKITAESAIAAGVRRIVAVTGAAAEEDMRHAFRLIDRWKQQLHVAAEDLPGRLEQLLDERRQMERELKALKRERLAGGAESLLAEMQEVHGIGVLSRRVEVESVEELRTLADQLRRRMTNGVAVLGAQVDGKAVLLVVVSEDLVRREVKAGAIVNRVADLAGGRGGGPPHMATGGAKDLERFPAALQQAPQVIDSYLRDALR